MKTVLFLSGLPASGKTTSAVFKLENDYTSYHGDILKAEKWIRINKDDLRRMMFRKWDSEKESLTLSARDYILRTSLMRGYNVIVDDTNLNSNHYKKVKAICENVGDVRLEHFHYNSGVDECIERDKNRSESVGEKVIVDMYNRYLKDGNFKLHEVVEIPPKQKVSIEQDVSLPPAIICDLDGTLALLNGRNPYDATECGKDILNVPVYDMIINECLESLGEAGIIQRTYLIFLSGRSDKYAEQTINWLNNNLPEYLSYELHMRHEGDYKPDEILKRELYDEFVAGKYFVKFVVDDRLKILRMWNSLGLYTFNVNQEQIEF